MPEQKQSHSEELRTDSRASEEGLKTLPLTGTVTEVRKKGALGTVRGQGIPPGNQHEMKSHQEATRKMGKESSGKRQGQREGTTRHRKK
jgi:hypothetical protein